MKRAVRAHTAFIRRIAHPIVVAIGDVGTKRIRGAVRANAIVLRGTRPVIDAAQAHARVGGVGACDPVPRLAHEAIPTADTEVRRRAV